MLLKCRAGEDSWESLGLQGDPTIQTERKVTLNIHWKDWCWYSNFWPSDMKSHWKRLWSWEGLESKGDGGRRGWDSWMASLTQWTWVWVNSVSWWCHPTISSSVVPFSSCFKSFPASGSFLTSQFFASGGQNIVASASASILPMNSQGWIPLGLSEIPLGSPCSPRNSQECFPAPQFKNINSLALSLPYGPTLTSIYDYWKTIALARWAFLRKLPILYGL